MAQALAVKEDFPKALEIEFKALHLSQELEDELHISLSFFWIGLIYLYSGEAETGLNYLHKLKPSDEIYQKNLELLYAHFGLCYSKLNKIDSALFFIKKSYDLEVKEDNRWCGPYFWMASIKASMGKYSEALNYYRASEKIAFVIKDSIDIYNGMAHIFQEINLPDSSIYYSKKAIAEAQTGPFASQIMEACNSLVEIYKSQQKIDSVSKYEELMTII